MHSKEVSDKLLEINKLINTHVKAAITIQESIREMDPGCIFDDFKNEEQVKGAMIILNWIANDLKS